MILPFCDLLAFVSFRSEMKISKGIGNEKWNKEKGNGNRTLASWKMPSHYPPLNVSIK